jgi:hypothetical protein
VCCNTDCAGTCRACNLTNSCGTCTNHSNNTDPEQGCGRYSCNGSGSCYTSCSGGCASSQCRSDSACIGTTCQAKKAQGATCSVGGCECTTGNCVDGRCCNTSCTGACKTCANTSGTCSNVANFTDPDNNCGRYTCNNAGACYTSCVNIATGCDSRCDSSSWCNFGVCQGKMSRANACIYPCSCSSGSCGFIDLFSCPLCCL